MGLSAALQLAAKGANIIIISRNQEKLDKALAEIKVGDVHARWMCPKEY